MREEYNDLDDKALEALIADVEKNGMIAPPVYLKELIMEEAAREEKAVKEAEAWRELIAENRGGIMQNKGYAARRAKVQFWAYSFKIAAAAAVAMFCLTAIPVDVAGGAAEKNNYMEEQIEKDIERYQQKKEKALAGEDNPGLGSFPGGWLKSLSANGADGIWDSLIN